MLIRIIMYCHILNSACWLDLYSTVFCYILNTGSGHILAENFHEGD